MFHLLDPFLKSGKNLKFVQESSVLAAKRHGGKNQRFSVFAANMNDRRELNLGAQPAGIARWARGARI
jgi:hypothetical protein